MWKSRSSPGLKRLFEDNTKTPMAGWSLLLRGQEEHRGREGVEAVRGQEGYWRLANENGDCQLNPLKNQNFRAVE